MLMAQGFTEVYNYSFVSEEVAAKFGFPPDDHVRVQNPIASDQNLLRVSLVPEIYNNITENRKHFEKFRLFEIGREIHKQAEGLPREIPHLVAAVYSKDDGTEHLFELKRTAECLMPGTELRPAEARAYEHPTRAAQVMWRSERVGRIFELHPNLLPGRAAILDLDLELVQKLGGQENKYTPLRRYPSSQFDLSVIAGARDLVADLSAKIVGFAGELLESSVFLREYYGPPQPENRKSVSFRLTVGSREGTLSLAEVGAIRARIIDGIRLLGLDLRV
jgi:phenylalanyl-tRNA synthetase beta chain